jgi:hypothetical protein
MFPQSGEGALLHVGDTVRVTHCQDSWHTERMLLGQKGVIVCITKASGYATVKIGEKEFLLHPESLEPPCYWDVPVGS